MKLREYRLRKGKTQEDVAIHLGIPKKTYQNYEREQREPNSDILCALADYYDITLDDLVGRTTTYTEKDYEDELLGCYQSMTDSGRIALLAIAHDLEAIFPRDEEEEERLGAIYQDMAADLDSGR